MGRPWSVLSVMLALGVAGCFSGPTTIDERFPAAHARFHNASPDGMSAQHEFEVPAGVPLVTVKLAIESDDGFEFALRDGANDPVGSYCCVDGNLSWQRLEWLSADNEEGTWSLSVECPAACEYVFALYLGERVGEVSGGFADRYTDGTLRIAQTPTGSHDFTQTVNIPPEAQWLEVRHSIQSNAEVDLDIYLPGGDYFHGGQFPYKTLIVDAVRKVADPVPGAYEVNVECKSDCDYAIGIYVT